MDRNLIISAIGKETLDTLERYNQKALVNSIIDGLKIMPTRKVVTEDSVGYEDALIVGEENPTFDVKLLADEFIGADGIDVKFGDTGLALASIEVRKNYATIKTTGTLRKGIIQVTVNEMATKSNTNYGTASIEPRVDIEQAVKDTTWAINEVAKANTPSKMNKCEVEVDGDRVEFIVEKPEHTHGDVEYYEILVTAEGSSDIVYRLRTKELKTTIARVADGKYEATVTCTNVNGYRSDVSDVQTFEVNALLDAKLDVMTSFELGSTSGAIYLTLENAQWLNGASVEVEGIEGNKPSLIYRGRTLSLVYDYIKAITEDTVIDITVPQECITDNVLLSTSIRFKSKPEFVQVATFEEFTQALTSEEDEISIELTSPLTLASGESIVINNGKNVRVKLSADITCEKEAFKISDDSSVLFIGGGTIFTTTKKTHGTIVASGAKTKVIVDGIGIDTKAISGKPSNFAYGIYLMNDASCEFISGKIQVAYGSCITTNNTTNGCTDIKISGGELLADGSYALYIPSQGNIEITGGTVQGINARMGVFNIGGEAEIIGTALTATDYDNIGKEFATTGCLWLGDTIAIVGGTYTDEDGTDCVVNISGNAKVVSDFRSAIGVYEVDTKLAQNITVSVETVENVTTTDSEFENIKVYDHEYISEQANLNGKTYAPTAQSVVTINVPTDEPSEEEKPSEGETPSEGEQPSEGEKPSEGGGSELPSEPVEDETTITGETLAVTVTNKKNYANTLLRVPIKPNTVFISIDAINITDDGNGNLVSDDINSGSINYETGAVEFQLKEASRAGLNIFATYVTINQ